MCAPTSAGKTVVGEMALRIALQRNSQARYTTPLKALSNQKFSEMRKVFGVDRVGLATGDVSIRRGADLTVCTTEVYRNMAWRSRAGVAALLGETNTNGISVDANRLERARSSFDEDEFADLSSNTIVVLDEFHYMGERGRGSVWEESVIFNPPHTQIVGLSATLPNARRLAAWMEATTGRASVLIEAGDARPVPLRYYFATRREFSPLFRDEEAGPGAPHGLLGLRGDGIAVSPERPKKKKKKKSFHRNDDVGGFDANGLPKGLSMHPTLQSAAEKTAASIDRRIQRAAERESFDARNRYGRQRYGQGPAMSARERRKMKEQLLKQELRKSVPSVATLLRRLEQNDLLPAIFFIFSRKGCDNAAAMLCEALKTKEEEKAPRRRRVVPDGPGRKGIVAKGKGRGRGRGHRRSTEGTGDLSKGETAMVQDEDGRNFRAELLDQLLSDEFDTTSARDGAANVEDESFLSEQNVGYYAEVGLLGFDETREVAARVRAFNLQNPEIAFSAAAAEQLLCGVGSHHAGMLPAHKALIETFFRVGLMQMVFATETLASGINMPARSTVIGSMAKRGDAGVALLQTHSLLQMAGRAGRRGMDAVGHCIIAATPFESPDDAIAILTNEIEPIRSQFAPSYALAVNLVERGGGKLDMSRNMVEKSFAAWERRQEKAELRAARDPTRNSSEEASPEGDFLDALQWALEYEIEACKGRSDTTLIEDLVEKLADGKKLTKMSKQYTGAVQNLILEQSTLVNLERELRQMEEEDMLDLELPSELLDEDRRELISAIRVQRRRVAKRETKVNSSLVAAMAETANHRIRAETDSVLAQALAAVRIYRDESAFSEEIPLKPHELNAYIQSAPKNNRRRAVSQSATTPSEDDENDNENWVQMSALFKILECYGCLVPQVEEGTIDDNDNKRYRVTEGGRHVGSLGAENSLWQMSALGGAWDVNGESQDLDLFREAFADFEDDHIDQEFQPSKTSEVAKPQLEANMLTSDLCQLSPAEMAGYVSSLVTDARRNSVSAIESFAKLTENQQRVVQGALLSLERMMEVQHKCGLDDDIGKCQLELGSADVVTAWASGCSWNEALVMSGAAPGDLVRILSRALDALRQLGNLPYLPAQALAGTVRVEASGLHPTIRSLCQQAANALDRYPVKDMLSFEEEDEINDSHKEELEDNEVSGKDKAIT